MALGKHSVVFESVNIQDTLLYTSSSRYYSVEMLENDKTHFYNYKMKCFCLHGSRKRGFL